MKFKFGQRVKIIAKDSDYCGAKAVVISEDQTDDGPIMVLVRDEMDDAYEFQRHELKLI